MNGIKKNHSIRYSSLTPNLKGFGSAVNSNWLFGFFIILEKDKRRFLF